MRPSQIKGTDLLYEDMLTVIFSLNFEKVESIIEEKCIVIFQDLEYDEPKTFDDIVNICAKYGRTEGTIRLLAENPLRGTVYMYNNYGDKRWHKYGTLNGYA